jgi:FKBP-type peptidyl-prolyl cis-trans isomerase
MEKNMFSKFEVIAFGASVAVMAVALYFVRLESLSIVPAAQPAAVSESGLRVVDGTQGTNTEEMRQALEGAVERGRIAELVVTDVRYGTGDEVKKGDTVVVNYVGTLENGQEFDNSYKRGQPFSFKVGAGNVIAGWEEGLIGMKQGGQRVLVIPPEKGYGSSGVGPIPANSTLIFSIELVEIK